MTKLCVWYITEFSRKKNAKVVHRINGHSLLYLYAALTEKNMNMLPNGWLSKPVFNPLVHVATGTVYSNGRGMNNGVTQSFESTAFTGVQFYVWNARIAKAPESTVITQNLVY